MDFLKQNNFRYIVIIIIIILAVINLCKINSQENFVVLDDDQDIGSHTVRINSTDQVIFGDKTLTNKLTNVDTLTVDGSTLLKGELEINSTIRKTRANEQNLHLVSDKVLHLMGKEGVHIYKCQDSSECNTWDGASGNLRVGNDLTVDGNLMAGDIQCNSIRMGESTTLRGGTVHIHSTKHLYLLSKSGTIIGKHWGGPASLQVQGTLDVYEHIRVSLDMEVKRNLTVKGATSVNDLTVDGNTRITGGIQVNDVMIVNGDMAARKNMTVSYTMSVGNNLFVGADLDVGTNLGVHGNTIIKGKLQVSGDSKLALLEVNSVVIQDELFVARDIRHMGAITYISDRRLKENIENISQNDKDKVLQLVPKTYNMISDQNKKHYGFIAQEVEELYPELVNTNKTDGMKSLNYIELIPLLLEQIKELKKSVEQIKTLINM